MGAKAQRARRRRIKLVGGGYRYSRSGASTGSSAKSLRRAMRKQIKDRKDLTPAKRRAMKEQVRNMYLAKNNRKVSNE
jgi:hypothetical protein